MPSPLRISLTFNNTKGEIFDHPFVFELTLLGGRDNRQVKGLSHTHEELSFISTPHTLWQLVVPGLGKLGQKGPCSLLAARWPAG